MTNPEFEREFDIEFNNIMSNAAPSIDPYEKSVFLTKAQEEIVIGIYDGSFEDTEKFRESIAILIETEEFDSDNALQVDESKKISVNSKMYKLGKEALVITYEKLKLKGKDKCGNEVEVLVKPTKQDDYFKINRNPFRRARDREALRLNTQGMLEIVSIQKDYIYQVRYLRKPRPIILYNHETYDNPGLTIDETDQYTECELSPIVHRAILDRAVQLAAQTYKS